MEVKNFSKIALLALSTSLVIPASSSYGETTANKPSPTKDIVYNSTKKVELSDEMKKEIDNSQPSLEEYDEQGNLVKIYSAEELEQLKQQAIAPDLYKPSPYEGMSGESYDENNNLISSTNKEYEKYYKSALEKVKAAGLNVTNFGSATFSSYIYAAQGRSFYNPKSVWLDTDYIKAMYIRLVDKDTGYVTGSYKLTDFRGEVNIPVSHLLKGNGHYKIKLDNANPNGAQIHINGGQVYY